MKEAEGWFQKIREASWDGCATRHNWYSGIFGVIAILTMLVATLERQEIEEEFNEREH